MSPASFKAIVSALPQAARAGLLPVLEMVAGLAASEARMLLDAGGRGPSDPSQLPADPSGNLANSIAASATPDGAAVTAASPYAVHLEYGTVTMAARPFLRPAIEATYAEAQTLLTEAYARSVKAALDKQT